MLNWKSVAGVWLGWAIARLGLVALLLVDPDTAGDVHYYFSGVYGPDPTVMTEYPHAGVWPVHLLAVLTGENAELFRWAFPAMCLLIDAVFLTLLLRFGGARRFQAGWFWVAFGLAVGPVLVQRLDLFPGLLVAAFAALLTRHPRIAPALLAGAAAVKLWPAALAATLVGGWKSSATWIRLGVFFGTLAALSVFTALTSGVDRLLSPLEYQGDRGLQIESLVATPFMVAAHFQPEAYTIEYATSKSFEISGPGTPAAVGIIDALMYGCLLAAIVWAAYLFFTQRWNPRPAVAFALVIVLVLIVTNKVFSPQYTVWFGPLIAVCLCLSASRYVRNMAWLSVAIAGLSLLIFPFLYDPLFMDIGSQAGAVSLVVLVSRNVLMLALTVLSLAWLAEESRRLGPVLEKLR
ncbi:DUF2029 domain-containing protein [Corynebacterium atrinae]|uniref:DUF2029 domain-containing protein n=1 Tax=Corynebacterium atrinae TaxID=1336740 RepID=UPI0025B61C7C|nr:DUF2029 domain-containing protein [Corynebacterium atrinae]